MNPKCSNGIRGLSIRQQENCHQDLQADLKAGDHKVKSQVICKTAENECHDNVEGPAPSQTKEETTNSLSAGAAGAPATLESFAHTDQQRRKSSISTVYLG
jgi:hypothetical protein